MSDGRWQAKKDDSYLNVEIETHYAQSCSFEFPLWREVLEPLMR